MVSGYVNRERRTRELVAWQTAHLLNVSGKMLRRRVTVKQLLRGAERTEDEDKALFDEFWQRLKADRERRGVTSG